MIVDDGNSDRCDDAAYGKALCGNSMGSMDLAV